LYYYNGVWQLGYGETILSITPRGMTVTEAYRDYRSGNLLVNRKYQRKLVWTLEEKEKLIGSIIKGYPIPLFLFADIAASILLNKPLPVDSKRLDTLYDQESKHFKELESTLAVYMPQKLTQDIIETFSIFRETIEAYSTESKCLRNIVNPESTNAIRSGFYTIFMAFFDLVITQKMTPTEPKSIMKALQGFQQKLNLSRNYKTIENREQNINQTKGLIQNYFARQEPPILGEGVELLWNIENSLRRSRIETSRYECKQGLLDLSNNRAINKNLITKIIETICGIANLGTDGDGYIFIGVVDKKSDADRIQMLDNINPIEINGRYIVGIDREAKILGKSTEDYVKILTNAILNSELTDTLKTQVMTKIDTISYKGHHTLIRITVPVQNDVSFVGNKAFTRQDSSTVEVNGKELIAISKLFN
jgi:hypothetical protein